MDKIRSEIRWEAPEFKNPEKGVSWYWLSMIIAVVLLAIAVWQKNFLFGFFIVIAEILLLTWADKTPRMISFTINDAGISIGEQLFYPYSEFSSFSVNKESKEEWRHVALNFSKRLRPSMKIYVPESQFEEIIKSLKIGVKEIEAEPSFFDALQDILRF